MYQQRIEHYRKLEKARNSKVLVYVTGDRKDLGTVIGEDAVLPIVHHLDRIKHAKVLSLVLYTQGGHTHSARSIVNLLRQFCDELEIIVPAKAHSAGTLMCLGANRIIMTKQATLGPIDPTVNLPINPAVAGAPNTRFGVSVEDVSGYIDFAKSVLKDETHVREAFQVLCKQVHPLVLGNAFRARNQIRMVAKKLMAHQQLEEAKVEQILSFLCSESGSHDYTIDRDEARDELGLAIQQPDDDEYAILEPLFKDVVDELKLHEPFNPAAVLGANNQSEYVHTRALIETAEGGSHKFESEGILRRHPAPLGQAVYEDSRSFDGWRVSNGS